MIKLRKQDIYDENQMKVKGSDRIQINNILAATCIGVLSVYLGTASDSINFIVVAQLAIAIPFLATSSLAYAKICYRGKEEYNVWNRLGWFCHSIGYICIINTIYQTLVFKKLQNIAHLFLTVFILLLIAYSVLDVILEINRWKEKVVKIIIYFVLIICGTQIQGIF